MRLTEIAIQNNEKYKLHPCPLNQTWQNNLLHLERMRDFAAEVFEKLSSTIDDGKESDIHVDDSYCDSDFDVRYTGTESDGKDGLGTDTNSDSRPSPLPCSTNLLDNKTIRRGGKPWNHINIHLQAKKFTFRCQAVGSKERC